MDVCSEDLRLRGRDNAYPQQWSLHVLRATLDTHEKLTGGAASTELKSKVVVKSLPWRWELILGPRQGQHVFCTAEPSLQVCLRDF